MRGALGSLLVVMPDAFHLGWMGATRRLFHLAYAFRELGYHTILLAGKMVNPELQADIDGQFPGLVIRTDHTGAYPRLLDRSPVLRRAWRAWWKLRGPEYYATHLSFGWAEKLVVGDVINELEHVGAKPSFIWGVSAGYLEGAMAAKRIAKALKVPWILELHDPPRGCGLGDERVTIRKEFCTLLKSSTRQVVTTESYRQSLIADFSARKSAVYTVYLTYEDILTDAKCGQDSIWRLLYAGSLDGGRSAVSLLLAFEKALSCQPDLAKNASIEIAGKGSGVVEVQDLVNVRQIGKSVRIHGYLSRERVDELAGLSSVLIVFQSKETSRLQIPGKIYDCFRLGKPILAIMPECETADILRRSGLGFVHPPEDIDGIANTMIRLWSDWRAGRPSVEMNQEYISQFSAARLPDKLRLVLNGL